jgi:hypothetical protein
MGRNVVDATNACRMRRTRGEIGLFLLAAAVCEAVDFFCEVADFRGAVFAPD